MALTILSGPTGLFDAPTRDQASLSKMLKLATFGQARFPTGTALASQSAATITASLLLKDKQLKTAQNFLAKTPDFLVDALTTAAETASVIELIARGVTFPADIGTAGGTRFTRTIVVDCYVTGLGATEAGFLRATGVIQGGATPTVLVTTVQGPSAVAAAGLTATPAVGFLAGAGSLNIQVTSAEAEPLNWKLKVFIGKLEPQLLPAT